MDSSEQLPIDMVEQLLKFTPSAEERALLDEHSEDIDSLARADRFLYEISKYVQHFQLRSKQIVIIDLHHPGYLTTSSVYAVCTTRSASR